jgi:hypothetical protein
MAQTKVGKIFLGSLFANRKTTAFDPFDLLYPPIATENQKKKLDPSDPIVAIKEGEREKYFDKEYGNLATKNGSLTVEAEKFVSPYSKLAVQLTAGANFFLKKCNGEVYPTERKKAEEIVGKFNVRVMSKVIPYNDLLKIIEDFENGNSRHHRNKFSEVVTSTDVDGVDWNWGRDTVSFAKYTMDHFTKWASASSFDNTAYGESPKKLHGLRLNLIISSSGIAWYEVLREPLNNRFSQADVNELLLNLTNVTASSAVLADDYGVDFAKEHLDSTTRQLFEVASPVIDVILVISDAVRVAKQWRERDYDAALVISGGMASTYIMAGMDVAAGGSLFGAVPGIGIAVGAMFGAAMLILEDWVNEPAIATLLRDTDFGTNWDNVESWGG